MLILLRAGTNSGAAMSNQMANRAKNYVTVLTRATH